MSNPLSLNRRSFDLGSSVSATATAIPSISPVSSLDDRLLQALAQHATHSANYEASLAKTLASGDISGDRILKKQADAADRAVQIQLLSVMTKKLLGIPETLLKG